ncbi:hypothetical protein ACIBEA_34165 [Streptomyces sp. NPDC051555]|uniref:hypothetical protein n=1 Tax=Streptomyces sp. NPDC051555 TaxID=3365657 RepID=UPI00379C38A0
MTEEEWRNKTPRHPRQLQNIYEFLDEIRIRPGAWVRDRSLQHLDSMLLGYRVGGTIHGGKDEDDFAQTGDFSMWLWRRFDVAMNPQGWAVEIERAAAQAGKPQMDMFFTLLDAFRAERHGSTEPAR